MCIAVVKKSNNENFSFFIAFVRDEIFGKQWLPLGKHWPDYTESYGYKDVETGGAWLSYNNFVLAITINKEIFDNSGELTRAFLSLEATQNSRNANEAVNKVKMLMTDQIRPFNLIIIDKQQAFLASNTWEYAVLSELMVTELLEEITFINRSFPNDMSEPRIAGNLQYFNDIFEPDPLRNEWSAWEHQMTIESYVILKNDEKTLWLESQTWGSLNADIISISRKGQPPFDIHHVKERSMHEC